MVKSDKHSIREAKVVAAFVTLGCLVFFIQVAGGPQKQPPPRRVNSVPVPVVVPTPQPSIEERTHAINPNEQHDGVPGLWASIDFKHRSYGPYRFYGGRKINLALKNGEYEYDFYESRGWFSLRDVYYVDITGDQKIGR